MVTIDMLRALKALAAMLMFFVMEVVAYGFAEIGKDSDKAWEKVFCGFMVALFFIFAYVIFYTR